MTHTERYKLKLLRHNKSKLIKSARRRIKAETAKEQARQAKLAANRRLDLRKALLRFQRYKCGICKRRQGTIRLKVDKWQGTLVRGLLCSRCDKFIARFKDEPRAVASYDGKISSRIVMSAVHYLENWPTQKLSNSELSNYKQAA